MQRRTAVLSLTLVVALGPIAACSGSADPGPASSTSPAATSASPTPTATPDVVVSGADARLAAVVEKVYAGKTGVTAKATTGTWKGEKVAVVPPATT